VSTTDSDRELLHATLEVWHPECWGITSTEEVGSGLVGHGAAVRGTSGYERCTVYGDSPEHVTQAIEVAHESSFIKSIEELGATAKEPPAPAIGRSTRDVFIEYDATEGIGSAFLSRGLVLNGTYRVEDGVETWHLLAYTNRPTFERTLDQIRDERDADVSLERLSPAPSARTTSSMSRRSQELTARQREAFTAARQRGYYEWPRHISAQELAAELDVSKATFLEHLRKAEAKLLGDEGVDS